MVKSKPHSEYWAGIHLSLESLTVLGLLVGLQLGELALGCLFPLPLAAAPLNSGLAPQFPGGSKQGEDLDRERGHQEKKQTNKTVGSEFEISTRNATS